MDLSDADAFKTDADGFSEHREMFFSEHAYANEEYAYAKKQNGQPDLLSAHRNHPFKTRYQMIIL
jgi:hypothetical protein